MQDIIGIAKFHKKVEELCETAKLITDRMYKEIEEKYKKWMGISRTSDYELKLLLFGNEILVEVEIPLYETTFEGRISCRMMDAEDEEEWIELETSYTFDSVGNINSDYNAYEAADELVKSLLAELRRKGITVKTKQGACSENNKK